jgi:uncharacterized membrane protein YfcA
MDFLIQYAHLWPELLMLLAAAGVGGILAGVFGVGGGTVFVPVLDYVLSLMGVDPAIRTHIAVGTSLAVIVPTSISSYISHRRADKVDMDVLSKYIIAVPFGVVLGSLIAADISSYVLRVVFAIIVIIVALKLIFDQPHWRLGKDLPSKPITFAVGTVIGLLSTLMGIGGGVLNNTFMTLYNRPVHQAVATSSGVGVLIAIPATIGFILAGWGEPNLPEFTLGFVHWLAVLIIIPITIYTAPIGARLAHGIEKQKLALCFGVFLLFVAAKFIYSVL